MTDFFDSSEVPKFIYGTAWKEDQTKALTKLALEKGFRAIDTANQRKHYYEEGVGEAVQEFIDENSFDRDDLFLQTKFTYRRGQDHRIPYDPDATHSRQVEQSLESSLDHLGVSYVDSLILHGPSSRSGLGDPDKEVWRKLEDLVDGSKVESIGVSNVTTEQLDELLSFSDKPPAYVQNRCFARTGWDQSTRKVCKSNNVQYQGFSLLTANQRELQSDIIREIASKNDITIPQVIFRFALDVGMLPLTGTTDADHMEQDLNCENFHLSDEEIESIETISI